MLSSRTGAALGEFAQLEDAMSLSIEVPGFANQKIELVAGFWANTLKVNGESPAKGPKKNEFLVKDDNGEEQVLTLKGKGVDLPVVVLKGEEYFFAKPVSTAAKIFAALFFLPLFLGGAVGGGLGAGGFMLSLQMFRSERPASMQYLLCVGCAAATWTIYLVIAGGVQSLVGN